MFVVLALLLVVALMETSVSILFPTVTAGGQVAYTATEAVWRTLVPGVLTLAAAGLGVWFEARHRRAQFLHTLGVLVVDQAIRGPLRDLLLTVRPVR